MSRKLSVDVVLPVYSGNIREIPSSVATLVTYFQQHVKDYTWTLVLAINGKQPEEVLALAKKLHKHHKEVVYTYTPHPGKGAGVLHAWTTRKPDIYTYMDIDLATDLHSFRYLLDGIREGYDLVIGSRYHPQSRLRRSFKRYLISKTYIHLVYRSILGVPVRDSQCGFKAVNKRVVDHILPLIQDKVWFWESEMLYLAHKLGYTIKEVPITWTENKISGVNLLKIAPEFIKKVLRLRFRKIR
ncbi:glycosyltransferase [Candidatus Woesearchaeota archaeon]|nr:glycosyltransferase [Candidatus Woesearchaeota archaeon]